MKKILTKSFTVWFDLVTTENIQPPKLVGLDIYPDTVHRQIYRIRLTRNAALTIFKKKYKKQIVSLKKVMEMENINTVKFY